MFTKPILLIAVLSVITLSSCSPTFPIHALKKGEWSGVASISGTPFGGASGSLGYGITDDATVYASIANLINYRLGLYYATTRSKGWMPELGVNGYFGYGNYSWIVSDYSPSPAPVPRLGGDLVVSYGGIGVHSIWQVDSSGTLLYAVANNYYQPNVGYAFSPSVGIAIPVTAGGTLFQVDLKAPLLSAVTKKEWQPLKKHFMFTMGLTF